jgi:hypothetical protein
MEGRRNRQFPQETDVGFGGIDGAVAPTPIGFIETGIIDKGITGIAEEVAVVTLGHMVIIVDPVGVDGRLVKG